VFAIDSIPAIFAVTLDPFVVFTANVFAILGLRSLFFVLGGMLDRFHYLKLSLAAVLRSPLFGLTDEQLYEVAAERKGSLRAALRQQGHRTSRRRVRRRGEPAGRAGAQTRRRGRRLRCC